MNPNYCSNNLIALDMSIDVLPDDCLLYIFDFVDKLKTLVHCSEVSNRWKCLVIERLKNVKYLSGINPIERYAYPSNTIYFSKDDALEELEASKWFPNLKILDVNESLAMNFISNLSVKGLNVYKRSLNDVTFNNPYLEMIVASHCWNAFANYEIGPKLTQAWIGHTTVEEFSKYAKYFPNLKRLHLECFDYDQSSSKRYSGPVLEKLEILELDFDAQLTSADVYYGFGLADSCPNLKSAYHYIQAGEEIFVDSRIKNCVLEHLVLEFHWCPSWSFLKLILRKYPNLTHLAIREENNTGITDENILELIDMLPCLRLIDLRLSQNVTEKSVEYIKWYCERYNRSISFYYQEESKITEEWPDLSTQSIRIGRGWDFLKYCFLGNLPYLLDPGE